MARVDHLVRTRGAARGQGDPRAQARAPVRSRAHRRDEPTLHLLLGDLYTRTGLTDLAAESFDEAQFRLKK
jgi:hypothetical protein